MGDWASNSVRGVRASRKLPSCVLASPAQHAGRTDWVAFDGGTGTLQARVRVGALARMIDLEILL